MTSGQGFRDQEYSVIQELHDEIVRTITPEKVGRKMCEDGLLSIREYEEFIKFSVNHRSKADRNDHLLKYLKTEYLGKFCDVLTATGFNDTAKIIRTKIDGRWKRKFKKQAVQIQELQKKMDSMKTSILYIQKVVNDLVAEMEDSFQEMQHYRDSPQSSDTDSVTTSTLSSEEADIPWLESQSESLQLRSAEPWHIPGDTMESFDSSGPQSLESIESNITVVATTDVDSSQSDSQVSPATSTEILSSGLEKTEFHKTSTTPTEMSPLSTSENTSGLEKNDSTKRLPRQQILLLQTSKVNKSEAPNKNTNAQEHDELLTAIMSKRYLEVESRTMPEGVKKLECKLQKCDDI